MADKKKSNSTENQGELVIYQTDEDNTKIDVHFVDETVNSSNRGWPRRHKKY